jgi:hypothetical protein
LSPVAFFTYDGIPFFGLFEFKVQGFVTLFQCRKFNPNLLEHPTHSNELFVSIRLVEGRQCFSTVHVEAGLACLLPRIAIRVVISHDVAVPLLASLALVKVMVDGTDVFVKHPRLLGGRRRRRP